MIEAKLVRKLVDAFPATGDGEAEKSRELILAVLDHTSAPFARTTFTPGHITCTGVVRSPDRTRILLVHHRRLDRWLLPGGHVEITDQTIAEVARREVLEETGAKLNRSSRPPLVGIDVHPIPPAKREPLHLHHDLIFAFDAASDSIACSEESRDVVWCAPSQFDAYQLPGSIRRSVGRALLNP